MLYANNESRYWALKNAWSVDGLPGMEIGQRIGKAEKIKPLKKFVGPYAPKGYQYPNSGFGIEHLVLAALVGALLTVLVLLYGAQTVAMAREVMPRIPSHVERYISAPLATLR